MDYMYSIFYKIISLFFGKAFAQTYYGPPDPDWPGWNNNQKYYMEYGVPVPKYGIVPVWTDYLYYIELALGAVLIFVALFFVWRRYLRKKKDVKKTDQKS